MRLKRVTRRLIGKKYYKSKRGCRRKRKKNRYCFMFSIKNDKVCYFLDRIIKNISNLPEIVPAGGKGVEKDNVASVVGR